MGFDCLPKHHITLTKCNGELIIKRQEETNSNEDTQTFQLSSFFNLLEAEKSNITKQGLSQITVLDLSYCDLTELPKGLKLLCLKVLNVSHNKLSTPPLCLYGEGLAKLETLDLSHNLITEFDWQPDCVLNLKKLVLNNNCFANVPSWFLTFRCIQLEELDYSVNRANHYNFSKHYCNFSLMKLRKLEMRDSCLVDSDFTWMKCFKNLQILDISNKSLNLDRKFINRLKDLNELFKKPHWKNLQFLVLCYLDISIFPDGIFWIVTLKELNISNNLISWFPEGIEHLVNLEYLNVSNNEMYILPKEICHLYNLKILLLAHNQLDEVPDLPENLEVLDLYDNKIQSLDTCTFKNIKYQDLDYNFDDLNECNDYCTSRDQYRALYNHNNRVSVAKFKDPKSPESCSCSSSDSEFDEHPTSDLVPIINIEEDWDNECEEIAANKHPEMTLSDSEHNGETLGQVVTSIKSKCNVYVSDEDWMFEDAD